MGIVRLLDLQLLYGIAGVREQFEKLCGQLICKEYPTARCVRSEGGDGGVDVFVGDQSDPEEITVFQVKYFPGGLKDSQKKVIYTSLAIGVQLKCLYARVLLHNSSAPIGR